VSVWSGVATVRPLVAAPPDGADERMIAAGWKDADDIRRRRISRLTARRLFDRSGASGRQETR
jgi:hypothetical protein